MRTYLDRVKTLQTDKLNKSKKLEIKQMLNMKFLKTIHIVQCICVKVRERRD